MRYSYNLLQSFVKQKLASPAQLSEALNAHLGDCSYEKNGSDYVFDLELTPNRIGPLSGHRYLADEICAIFDLDLNKKEEFKIKKVPAKDQFLFKLKNDAKKSCAYYSGLVLTDIKIKESPRFVKDALIACNIRSINNVVDITNYVMLELGQPMHAFDYDKIIGNKIVVRHAFFDEQITSLTGECYDLNKDILVIADGKNPMAIAGVKGGVRHEIDEETSTIVLESANFNSVDVYKASKSLGLATDASVRFSHKLSLSLAKQAMARAAELLIKYANAKIVSNVLETNDFSEKLLIIPFNLEKANKIIGDNIGEKQYKKILEKLGYKIKQISKTLWNVSVPPNRTNILILEDIVDDILRIYGLNNLNPIAPQMELKAFKRNEFYLFKNQIKDYMSSMGLTEVYNYNFISDFDKNILPVDLQEKTMPLLNALSSNLKYLNPTSVISLLKNVETNLSYFDKARFFDVKKNFWCEDVVVSEKLNLSFCLYNIDKKEKDTDMLLEAKGIMETIFEKCGIDSTAYYFSDKAPSGLEGMTTLFKKILFVCDTQGKRIGYFGIVNDEVKSKYKLKNDQRDTRVIVSEIDMEKLFSMVKNAIDFRPLPKYPSSIKDMSVIVKKNILVNNVMADMFSLGIDELKDVDIFDIYDQLEEGDTKSLSFHLIFRSDSKTLESCEVDLYMDKIKKHLTSQGYIIR